MSNDERKKFRIQRFSKINKALISREYQAAGGSTYPILAGTESEGAIRRAENASLNSCDSPLYSGLVFMYNHIWN